MFDEVDVSTQIEVVAAGQKIVKPLVVPATNRKSIEELTKEIRAGQAPEPGAARRYRATLAFWSIPRPLRSVAWRAVMSNATWFKRLGGTVGLSSVGMFGPGGGWGIPIGVPLRLRQPNPRILPGRLCARIRGFRWVPTGMIRHDKTI